MRDNRSRRRWRKAPAATADHIQECPRSAGVLITSAKSAAKAHEYATLPGWITGNSNMNADRRREVVDVTLEALRHTVGRDEHMPFLKQLVERQIGPVTFAEIADGLASIDVSGCDPEWREVWAELIETIRRAARLDSTQTP